MLSLNDLVAPLPRHLAYTCWRCGTRLPLSYPIACHTCDPRQQHGLRRWHLIALVAGAALGLPALMYTVIRAVTDIGGW